jgi:ketopantoate reductase
MAGVHILGGGGSLGLLLAAHLRKVQVPVTLLIPAGMPGSEGPSISSVILENRTQPAATGTSAIHTDAEVESLPQSSKDCSAAKIKHLVVATKGADVAAAVASIQHRLDPESSVLLLQNGILAVYEELHRKVSVYSQPG